MGRNSAHKPAFRPLFIERWGSLFSFVPVKKTLVGAIALTAIGVLPTQAEELKDWQYDTQTRSLTLTLPESVVPLISVIAPDQLVLELSDTQVGDIMAQSVRDGLVESIVLEQATPETVWIVMDFAAGTVLSTSQSATPIVETATNNGEQRWQVRPALVAASRTAAQSVAGANLLVNTGSASSLRTPAADIAQSPDFSDLPVLEPAMPISEPVIVPPLNTPVNVPPLESLEPSEPAATSVPQLPTESADVAEQLPAETMPVFEVPVIPVEEPVASEPTEPPFLDEWENDSLPAPVEALSAEAPVATEPVSDERIASSSDSFEDAIEPAAVESAIDIEPAIEPVVESAVERTQPSSASRWPEPIPFGQPLPR